MSARRPLDAVLGRARHVRRAVEERRLRRRLAGPRLLRAFAEAHERVFFVEIGSNDGEQHDHLRPFILGHGWSGIMVEPVPYIFERLQANYRDVPGVALENVAVAREDGRLPFFHLVPPKEEDLAWLPDWYDGIGSFSRESVERHVEHIPDIAERIVEARVPSLTFGSLLARHGDPAVDLLVVDTEGFDFEVLQTIDFTAHRPRMVIYEHFHLAPEDRAACRALLQDAGFETIEEGFDTWCVRTDRDDALTRAWRRAQPALPGLSAHDREAAHA